MIGYPSGQGGAILPARDTGYVPQGTFIMLWCFILYNKSFIDQACSVKMAGYLASFFFCVFKHAKKELGQYPAILTSRLVNNPYLFSRTNSNLIFPILLMFFLSHNNFNCYFFFLPIVYLNIHTIYQMLLTKPLHEIFALV